VKQLILISLLLSCANMYGQTKVGSAHHLLTSKYAGIYGYGKDAEKERVGSITLFPETDSTMLFYIDLNRGAPSYNMGSLYGRLKIKDSIGLFYRASEYIRNEYCKWLFTFSKNKLVIKTIDGQYSCDFGYAVVGDGEFRKEGNSQPDFFIDPEEKTIYFVKTKPEDYLILPKAR